MGNVFDRLGGVPTLYVSPRAANVLKRAGIEIPDQLQAIRPRDLLKVYGCGLKTYREIVGYRTRLFRRTRPGCL